VRIGIAVLGFDRGNSVEPILTILLQQETHRVLSFPKEKKCNSVDNRWVRNRWHYDIQ
jgi:hypothetical protein